MIQQPQSFTPYFSVIFESKLILLDKRTLSCQLYSAVYLLSIKTTHKFCRELLLLQQLNINSFCEKVAFTCPILYEIKFSITFVLQSYIICVFSIYTNYLILTIKNSCKKCKYPKLLCFCVCILSGTDIEFKAAILLIR